MANTAIHLGVAGSQVELAYPDVRPIRDDPRGRRIIPLYDNSLHYHSQGIKWGWSLSWSDLTDTEADEIQTEFERDQELSFVIGSVSYEVLVRPGTFTRDPIPGTEPILYNMRLELVESS